MRSRATQPPFDIHANSLLAATFGSPAEVLSNPVLSNAEKRCVLAAWASDAFAVEGEPWMRQLPGSSMKLPLSHIFQALRELDGDDGDDDDPPPLAGALRVLRPDEPALAVGF